MPRKLTIGRWFAAPLLVGTLTLTACGSDDNPAAAETSETPAYEEFCTALAGDTQSPDNPDEEADLAEFEAVVRIAPEEIADDMQDLLEMFVQISEFDEMTASADDIAAFEAVLVKFDPLGAKMEAWAAANCPGFELD